MLLNVVEVDQTLLLIVSVFFHCGGKQDHSSSESKDKKGADRGFEEKGKWLEWHIKERKSEPD